MKVAFLSLLFTLVVGAITLLFIPGHNVVKEPEKQYSYFTYFGPTLYECSKRAVQVYGTSILYDCTSMFGTKIDTIHDATNVMEKER